MAANGSVMDFFEIKRYVPTLIVTGLVILLAGFLFPIYMYPSRTARRTSHEQATALIWINGLFGITIIGWVAMLMWAGGKKE
ncbi:MAG: superinfection immunity protein [Ruminococcus sp.]|nr:superinfection immunity protein [Ruminococcus sp.]